MIPTKQAVSRSSHHSLLQSIDSWRPSLEVEPPPPWVPSLFSQPPLPPIPQQYLPLCLVTSLLQLHILTIDGYPGLGIITFTLCAALGEIVRGKSDGGETYSIPADDFGGWKMSFQE
ncbi:hypothetical protein CDAR_563211 [Caerostris darwini]|uniref:Uncharacterized protein n=1 Tax=Caerostris darwini TaxID=1538125 RepID=A0AAV4UVL6_9ARAC|nr:hypothetical protein CDAR_563211 [Caerostris darwini]